jgi:ribosomal-protein-alanine N-acetyltransferase
VSETKRSPTGEGSRRVTPPGGIGDAPVYLRTPALDDAAEFLDLMLRSRSLHHPWIQPPVTEAGFRAYLSRMARADHEGFLVCRRDDHAIAGVINVNNIVHGAFLSASLGYYSVEARAARGFMTEGLQQVIRVAFELLGLHRLEANIQPGNARSIGLVRRLGFRREGFSPAYLYIDGAWRDHERWALVDGRETLLPPGIPDEVARRVP